MPKPRLTTSSSQSSRAARRGDDLIHAPIDRFEIPQRPKNLAADGRVVDGLGRLLLVGVDDDVIDQNAGYPDLLRSKRAESRQPFHLRDDDPAIVARRQGLIQGPQISPFMLHREIAAFIGSRRADNRDVRRDGGEKQPFVAFKVHHPNDFLDGALFIRAPFRRGSTKVSIPTLVRMPGRPAADSRCIW